MAPYKIIIAYDGSRFSGFQRQVRERTVQGEIEKALRGIGWQEKTIKFAGRTDTGVHAEGQVISFNLAWSHDDNKLLKSLNQGFPKDISGSNIEKVEPEFHPRFDAKKRLYRYQMYQYPTRDCLKERYHWRIWPEMNMALVNQASKYFLGLHDFQYVGKPSREGGSTIRTIMQLNWKVAEGGKIQFHLQAESFLYHMVRRIVFLLVKAGQGKITIERIETVFQSSEELPSGIAPAKGLFLEKIEY